MRAKNVGLVSASQQKLANVIGVGLAARMWGGRGGGNRELLSVDAGKRAKG